MKLRVLAMFLVILCASVGCSFCDRDDDEDGPRTEIAEGPTEPKE